MYDIVIRVNVLHKGRSDPRLFPPASAVAVVEVTALSQSERVEEPTTGLSYLFFGSFSRGMTRIWEYD